MILLVVIAIGLVMGSVMSGRYVRKRAEAPPEKQARYRASEVRTSGHVWLFGAILLLLFGIAFVRHLVLGGLGSGEVLLAVLLTLICIAAATHSAIEGVRRYRLARAIGRQESE